MPTKTIGPSGGLCLHQNLSDLHHIFEKARFLWFSSFNRKRGESKYAGNKIANTYSFILPKQKAVKSTVKLCLFEKMMQKILQTVQNS